LRFVCPNCSNPLAADDAFCDICGAAVQTAGQRRAPSSNDALAHISGLNLSN
jgi:predicted amidophosphoribosyltransferase